MGRNSARYFIGTSFGHFVNDGNFFLFPILIIYYTNLDIGFLILGVGAIIQNLVSGLLSSPIGVLADRLDRDGLLIAIGLSLEALSLLIFAITFSERQYGNILVLTGTCVLGFGQAFYHPIGGSVLTLVFPKGRFERALGFNGAIASTGRAILPSMIGISVASLGYADGLYAILAYTVIATAFIYYALSTFRRSDYGAKESDEQKPAKERVKLGKYRGFLTLLISIIFLRSMFTVGVTTFLALYLTIFIKSHVLITEIITIMLVPAIVGQPFLGSVTASRGGRFAISLTTVLSVLFYVLFMITHILAIMITAYAAFVFVVYSGFPTLMGYVGQVVPSKIITTANSLVWGVGGTIGGAVGIAVVTVLKVLTSITTAFWVMLIFGIAATIMLVFLPSRSSSSEKPTSVSEG